jgi:3-hydroxyacyl-CoA dehydrogenase/enoyl-CoA hydratase/3-hydroxybutyryl-CoA epimerase
MSPKTNEFLPGIFTPAPEPVSEWAGVRLDVGQDGLARITFDAPGEKVNILTTPAMERLDALLTEVRGNGAIKGLIFRSGKPKMFIAGADISEIESITDTAEGEGKARRGQQVFQRIADLDLPTVAAIDGPCLGGGCELALACDFRIASDGAKVQIGLPEVKLGILPGFGGTQRLPALIPLASALDIILAGKTLDAKRALRTGLVDRVVPSIYLDAQAEKLLLEAIAHGPAARSEDGGRRNWRSALGLKRKAPLMARLLEATPPGRALIGRGAARALRAKVRERDYPAPYLALRATVDGRGLGLARGLDNEARLLGELIATPTSKNLIFLFNATTRAKGDSGVSGPVPPPRAIGKVGVLGAGQMGAGIAASCASAGTLVRMRDVSWEALARGMASASKVIDGQLKRRKIDARIAAERRAALSATTGWSGFRAADLVVEAVLENLDVKRDVFHRLESLVEDDAILASNTSSIPIGEIAALARRPERFIGLHFFNPVDRMPLVEVITHRGTDRTVTATVVEFAKRLGKTPVVVKDAPGFLVNRLLMPYLGEALLMFEEGGQVGAIDEEIRGFGLPMGPFELLDQIGLDVAQHVSRVLLAAFGDRFPAPTALDKLVAGGRGGVKSGSGFYRYDSGGKRLRPDPEAGRIVGVARARRSEELPGRPAGRLSLVQERLLLPMINEAAIALGEGIVRSPIDVDLAMVMGTGFPPFRGGLLRFADSAGTANLVERLDILAQTHGRRFAPALFLKDLARSGRNFHAAPY